MSHVRWSLWMVGCVILLLAGSLPAGTKLPPLKPTSAPAAPPAPSYKPLIPETIPAYKATLIASGLDKPAGVGVNRYGQYAFVNEFGGNRLWRYQPGGMLSLYTDFGLDEGLDFYPSAGKMWNQYYFGNNWGGLYRIEADGSRTWVWNYGGPGCTITAIGIDHSTGLVYFMLTWWAGTPITTNLYRFDPRTGQGVWFGGFDDISYGIAVKGNLVYISLYNSGTIVREDKRDLGNVKDVFASGLGGPSDMEFDAAGNLYFTEGVGRVSVIKAGTRAAKPLGWGFSGPLGLALNPKGDIFFSDYYGGALWVLKKK